MLRFCIAAWALAAWASLAQAQVEPARSRGVAVEEEATPAQIARRQKRREELRQSLRAPVEDALVPARTLSAQEKADLRQQMQLLRPDSLK